MVKGLSSKKMNTVTWFKPRSRLFAHSASTSGKLVNLGITIGQGEKKTLNSNLLNILPT